MSSFKSFLVFCLVFLSGISVYSQAVEVSEDNFEVYFGDFNGDGLSGDIYFYGSPKFVLIHGEISVPLFITGEDGFALYEGGNGIPQPLTVLEEDLTNYTKAIVGTDVFFEDIDGDGVADARVIRPGGLGEVVLASNANNAFPTLYSGNMQEGSVYSVPSLTTVAVNPANDALSGDIYYGALTGEHSIGPDGSFSYSIPIEVPPGINGMQPNLALNYNSNTRNGYLGWGWSLSGKGENISRCRADIIRDGYISGVNAGETYKFCLGTMRLVEVADGEYRTEHESFTKIIHIKIGGENYWEVFLPNGSVQRFGGTVDATLEDGTGGIMTWYQSDVRDVSGNSMSYEYDKLASGVHRIKSIEYTKNVNAAKDANHTIEFNYVTRDDKKVRYVAGAKRLIDERLGSITVKTNNEKVREYAITYQAVGTSTNEGAPYEDPVKTSRIQSIGLCHGDSLTKCSTPIQFSWNSQAATEYVATENFTPLPQESPHQDLSKLTGAWPNWSLVSEPGYSHRASFNGAINEHFGFTYGDFDGDGLKEVARWSCNLDVESAGQCHHHAGIETAEAANYGLNVSGNGIPYYDPVHGGAMDFDGDGRDDYFVTSPRKAFGLAVYLSRDNGFEFSPEYSFSGNAELGKPETLNGHSSYREWNIEYRDINGDGLVDIIRSSDHPQKSLKSDFSRADLNETGIYVALNRGYDETNLSASGFSDFSRWGTITDYSSLAHTRAHLKYGDVNGDGLADIIGVRHGVDVEVGINTGSVFQYSSSWSWGQVSSVPLTLSGEDIVFQCSGTNGSEDKNAYLQNKSTIADFNGDGLADIGYLDQTGFYVALSDGVTFSQPTAWTTEIDFEKAVCGFSYVFGQTGFENRIFGWEIVDANRDGASDIYFRVRSQSSSVQDYFVLYSDGHNGFSSTSLIATTPFPDTFPTAPGLSSIGTSTTPTFFAQAGGEGTPSRPVTGVVSSSEGGSESTTIMVGGGASYTPGPSVSYYGGSGNATPNLSGAITTAVPSSAFESVDPMNALSPSPNALLHPTMIIHFGRLTTTENGDPVFIKHSNNDPESWQTLIAGPERNEIKTINEGSGRELNILYKNLNRNPDLYSQNHSEQKGLRSGRSDRRGRYLNAGGASPMVFQDQTRPGLGLGFSAVANVELKINGAQQSFASYQYQNLRSHIGGFGNLGFEKVISNETIPGITTEKIRTITEFYQEVGASGDYLLVSPKKSIKCVASPSVVECGTGAKILNESQSNWKVLTYSDDNDDTNGDGIHNEHDYNSPHYFSYLFNEEAKTYSLEIGPTNILTSWSYKSLDDWTDKTSCPSFALIDKSSRTADADTYHDAYGTALKEMQAQCDTFGVTGTQTENSNILNLTNGKWILGLVQDPKVHTWVSDGGSAPTEETRHTNFLFDNSTGQVTEETREPNAGNDIWLKKAFTYSNYGSVASLTETVKNFTNDGIDFVSRSAQFFEAFDSFGKRTIVSTNPEGHITTEVFNAKFGSVDSATDINDLTATFTYDELGRPKTQTVLGITKEFDYHVCGQNCFTYNADAAWYVQQKSTGTSASRIYYDNSGREVGKRWRGLTGGFYYSGTRYNDRGLVAASTEPFESFADATGLETKFTYDILSRVTETEFPLSTTQTPVKQTANYSAVGGAVAVTTTDTLGRAREQRFDALDREKTIKDALGGLVAYWHDAQGNVNKIKVSNSDGSNAEEHTIEFDKLSRKTALNDPDIGRINYTYNAFGHLTTQINDENERICYEYDKLDRNIRRFDNASTSCGSSIVQTWTYDQGSNQKGLLNSIVGQDTQGRAHQEIYTYTSDRKLPESVTNIIAGNSYTVTSHYDSFNRPKGVSYPSGFTVENEYNSYGFLDRAINHHNTNILWQAHADDQRGNLTHVSLGNNINMYSAFKNETGLIESRNASHGSTKIQDHLYNFDTEGNLTQRIDQRVSGSSIIQNFCYDPLDRLTDEKIGSACTSYNTNYVGTTYKYDIHGNLLRKDGVDGYCYGTGPCSVNNTTIDVSGTKAGPHAVSYANGLMKYDDAGRMIESPGQRSIDYSIFGKPTYMGFANGYQTGVIYGALQKRIERRDMKDGDLTQTVYVDKIFERISSPEGIEYRHYMADWGVHVVNRKSNEEYNVYFTRDHIGSLASKTDDNNSSNPDIRYHANDSWGRRTDKTWAGVAYDTLSGEALKEMTFGTTRGFTDHEHLDGVGLIHMNGRVYDPVVGRFVSPDPWIQDPEWSQSFNRYSYVWNNPLRYTDPTGEYLLAIGHGHLEGLKERWNKLIEPIQVAAAVNKKWAEDTVILNEINGNPNPISIGNVSSTKTFYDATHGDPVAIMKICVEGICAIAGPKVMNGVVRHVAKNSVETKVIENLNLKGGNTVNTGTDGAEFVNCGFCTIAGAKDPMITSTEAARKAGMDEGKRLSLDKFENAAYFNGFYNVRKLDGSFSNLDSAVKKMQSLKMGTKFGVAYFEKRPNLPPNGHIILGQKQPGGVWFADFQSDIPRSIRHDHLQEEIDRTGVEMSNFHLFVLE